jgi:glucosamine-6-phosphate deaminase
VIEGPISDRAVALGLATILEAREVVMLVSDASKREALRRVVDGPVTEQVPASILQHHPRCTILADRSACP